MYFFGVGLTEGIFAKEPQRSAERNLVAAVLAHALLDLQSNRPEKARKRAYDYLMGRGVYGLPKYEKYPFLIEKCCEQLELSVKEIRRIATELYNNPAVFDI